MSVYLLFLDVPFTDIKPNFSHEKGLRFQCYRLIPNIFIDHNENERNDSN